MKKNINNTHTGAAASVCLEGERASTVIGGTGSPNSTTVCPGVASASLDIAFNPYNNDLRTHTHVDAQVQETLEPPATTATTTERRRPRGQGTTRPRRALFIIIIIVTQQ